MIGYTSSVVNGQLIHVPPGQSFAPLTFGPMYTGPGFWPRNGVYNVPPVLPSPGTWEGSTTGLTGPTANSDGGNGMSVSGMGGGTPIPTAGAMSKNGGVNYYHPTKSPLLWGIGFLALSLLLLHKVHYAKG